MGTNRIVIQFAGTQDESKTVYIDNVSEYFVDSENRVLTVIANGRKQFFNFNLMFYVGCVEDLEK